MYAIFIFFRKTFYFDIFMLHRDSKIPAEKIADSLSMKVVWPSLNEQKNQENK